MQPVCVNADDITISAEEPDFELATLVTAAGFARPLTPELALDVANHLAESGLRYSVKCRGELGGYALFRTFGPVLYLSGMMLGPELQGRGLAPKIIQRAQVDTRAEFLGLRTQSLRMWLAGLEASNKVCWLPNPSCWGPADTVIAEHAARLVVELGCDFPITRGFYGQALYGVKPACPNHSPLQAWWDSICNLERGDAVLCIGRLR